MPKARVAKEARKDLDEIWLHIARDSIDAAERVLAEIHSAAKNLSAMPGMGPPREELGPGLRSFPVRDYLLFYRTARGGIEIVRVVHGARNLNRIFRRK